MPICAEFTESQCAEINQLLTFNGAFAFNQELVDTAIYGGLLMFVTGLGVGLIMALIRKLKH